MANEQNLRPSEYKLTLEEQKKGGIASGEARRQKRDLRKALEILLEKTVTKDKDGNEISGAEAIALKQFEKALKGDTRAFEVVRDTSGQKPVEKVEVGKIDREQSLKELQELFDDTDGTEDTTTN
jgi:hypothetical protein